MNRAIDAAQTPDEYIEKPFAVEKPANTSVTVAMLSEEVQKLMSLSDAMYAYFQHGEPESVLRAAYDDYSAYCDVSPDGSQGRGYVRLEATKRNAAKRKLVTRDLEIRLSANKAMKHAGIIKKLIRRGKPIEVNASIDELTDSLKNILAAVE